MGIFTFEIQMVFILYVRVRLTLCADWRYLDLHKLIIKSDNLCYIILSTFYRV